MRFLRLTHLLLGLALLAWAGVSAASLTCEETCEVQKQKAFHRERPKCECGSGYHRPCQPGSYYAHTASMCIFVSREVFTHREAEEFCAKRFVNSGFLAFVENWDESYDISHYVWNDLKQGVEGDETFFWTSGKFSTSTRTEEKFWLYEYHNSYFAEVPETLFPDKDSTRDDAETDGRHCIAGHTEDYGRLHARDCSEKLPAVCYYYRDTAGWYCKTVEGMVGTLFRKKCYYQYSAPVPYATEGEKYTAETEKYYRTWFEARDECRRLGLGARLASVHDEATHEKLTELSLGRETKLSQYYESTWIGLQTGCVYNEAHNETCGVVSGGCYWPDGERPCKQGGDGGGCVYQCSTTYTQDFLGRWEDDSEYNHTESRKFWALKEPNADPYPTACGADYSSQNSAYCSRGYEGHSDRREHCAQIFPASEDQLAGGMKYYARKWNDYWCWRKNRGYVCQRDALRSTTGSVNDEL
ncbi:hypothetical protein AAVH_11188 [Aphelenchoides avenae]|nr:hypothetical protein AAVH_11188 [Aphelenchus avenae]